MTDYFKPVVQWGSAPTRDAVPLGGGPGWFGEVDVFGRGRETTRIPACDLPGAVRERLSAPRGGLGGLDYTRPCVMGILNVTPDSFSDGGDFDAPAAALAHAEAMHAAGADILDLGGESTRPGADVVSRETEAQRVVPLIRELAGRGMGVLSVDTRNARTAQAALAAGAELFNDVSALSHDADSAGVAAGSGAAVCLMHAQGDPKTMQDAPFYENVLLDVYDYLSQRIETAVAAGVVRERIIVDPGIGFGKTVDHNLTLLRHVALFHALGVAVLVGASRKRFIGVLGDAPEAKDRLGGSVAVALMAARAGVQILRVHDVRETVQALRLMEAVEGA